MGSSTTRTYGHLGGSPEPQDKSLSRVLACVLRVLVVLGSLTLFWRGLCGSIVCVGIKASPLQIYKVEHQGTLSNSWIQVWLAQFVDQFSFSYPVQVEPVQGRFIRFCTDLFDFGL